MDQNFSSTKYPSSASSAGGGKFGGSPWSNPMNVCVDDSSSASWGAFAGGQGAAISATGFDFPQLPDAAVIDGIQVFIEGYQFSAYGSVMLNLTGTTFKDMLTLNTSYGSATDKWGATTIDKSQLATLTVTVDANDVSGGDALASIEHLRVTIYWHIDPSTDPADVPTRVVHKVYSRDGNYLGEMPASSQLAFSQDINSAGSMMELKVAKDLRNVTEVDALMTEDGDDILTEDDHIILAEITEIFVTTGESDTEALYKNSNRIKSYVYNHWHPNGLLVFSGQINRISFSYGSSTDYVNVKVYSDGHDLANYIARGYPFTYTTDVSQVASGDSKTLIRHSWGGWDLWGQTFRTGAAVTNIGRIMLRLNGSANVTLVLRDSVGNLLGSVTKLVSTAGWENLPFEFSQLIDVLPSTDYQFTVWVDSGQSILIANAAGDVYANGTMLYSSYAGGSGGGTFYPTTGDLYFETASGLPTTTTTYATQDPVTSMMDKILTDYNNRGGLIKKRTFQATGLSLTYLFNQSTIFDAMKKVIEMSPLGYYAYVDLGLAKMDILKSSTTPDFSIVRGRDINNLDIALTIEQVKNYLLFTGGDTGGGTNLYRDYQDTQSASNYGLRTVPATDNRVTLAATANAIGETFIAENADEAQETELVVSNEAIDISLLVPGKTIGFRNFGNFIDDFVLVIVRREPNFSKGETKVTLGRLPVTLSAEVQRINRELLNEQTVKNPASPS